MPLETTAYQDALVEALRQPVRTYSGEGINAQSFVGSAEGDPNPGAHQDAIDAANARADQFTLGIAQAIAAVTETYIKSGLVQVTIVPGQISQLGPPNPVVVTGEVL